MAARRKPRPNLRPIDYDPETSIVDDPNSTYNQDLIANPKAGQWMLALAFGGMTKGERLLIHMPAWTLATNPLLMKSLPG